MLPIPQCAMTVRAGWKLYQRCDEAIGNAVTSVRGADGSFGMRGDLGGGDAAAAAGTCAWTVNCTTFRPPFLLS